MSRTAEIGRGAEDLACEFLLEEGFRILHRNWRHGRYELDVVAEKGGTMHIVEVKCRRRGGLTTPEEALGGKKSGNMLRAAVFYAEENGVRTEVQFDLIAVEYSSHGAHLRYYQDVLHPRW